MYDEDAIYRIIELIDGMLDSIQIIQERVSGIKSANDFLIVRIICLFWMASV